jgi:hypothetical protein
VVTSIYSAGLIGACFAVSVRTGIADVAVMPGGTGLRKDGISGALVIRSFLPQRNLQFLRKSVLLSV